MQNRFPRLSFYYRFQVNLLLQQLTLQQPPFPLCQVPVSLEGSLGGFYSLFARSRTFCSPSISILFHLPARLIFLIFSTTLVLILVLHVLLFHKNNIIVLTRSLILSFLLPLPINDVKLPVLVQREAVDRTLSQLAFRSPHSGSALKFFSPQS